MLSPDSAAHYKEHFDRWICRRHNGPNVQMAVGATTKLCAGFNMSHAAIDGNPEAKFDRASARRKE
jgi:hypothetical protein